MAMDQQQIVRQAVKFAKTAGKRSARFYYTPVIEKLNAGQPVVRAISTNASGVQSHPLVLVSVGAGILGVAMVILIVFSVWLRRKCYDDIKKKQQLNMTTYSTASCQTVTSLAPSTVFVVEELTTSNNSSVPVGSSCSSSVAINIEAQGVNTQTISPVHKLDVV